ncbi:hypothetical protein [Pseudoteredinibacter isoporae]|uniref:Transcriptional regulator SutA RNAP-binding domain-containing protein n=1 Tax=Pseudoteredinibacter isoporae TaxID=570281 RepID=A0A7X0JTL8_9GAMM|nr:hypothetical protein [Pseudoteredinibacter isoporae]MBB6521106.1 hypothetical protein [Pseudoteredinibacter isoporae]NHO86670.1 hypothetical protein [Pseudoteredinibacter isoporae]NIB24878.1 hypothetical protein [Pseudoteredinibacter isoporae]
MKTAKTKAQIRAEIENQIESFLSRGGEVVQFQKGVSGLPDGAAIQNSFSPRQVQSRTPVVEVVKAIDARRQVSKTPVAKRKPKKILLKDDFGDPIRWVWQDS